MTPEQQKEAKKLLQATLDILKKCETSFYIIDVLEVTAIWDSVECDGACLMSEVDTLLDELQETL